MAHIWRLEMHTVNGSTGQEQISSVHYQDDGTGGADEMTADQVVDAVLAHWSSSSHNASTWRAAAYGACTFTECVARQEVAYWDGEIAEAAALAIGLTGSAGATGSPQTPDGLAPWIKLTTGAATRSGHGGVHLPGPFSALLLNGSGVWDITGAWWTTVNTLISKLIDSIDTSSFFTGRHLKPVIYSQTRRRRGLTPYTFDVNNGVASVEPRWLRRRMRAG